MNAAQAWLDNRTEHWITAAWAEGACKELALRNPDAEAFMLVPRAARPEDWLLWDAPLWILFPCDIADRAGIAIGCSREVLQKLSGLALGGSQDAGRLAAQTYRELITRAVASVGAALETQSGAQARFAGGVDVAAPEDPSLAVEFSFEIAGAPCTIALAPNAAFLDGASRQPEEAGAPNQKSEQAAETRPAEEAADFPRRNLELLLDLEMEVAVSFGETEMLLKDVLNLSVGSIVELKRQASDPVEVLVNNTVIARGEVVVADGNYGVRITEVSSRRERIQSIF